MALSIPPAILPLTFAIAFSARKRACGPEARALRAKASAGKELATEILPCFRRTRRAPRRLPIRNLTSFFPFRIPQSAFRISIARPTRK